MRLEAKGSWLLSLALLGNLVGCGGKEPEGNTGFGKGLVEAGKDDYRTPAQKEASSLWDAVIEKLEIPDIDQSSLETVTASLSVPSTLITDATKSGAEVTARVGAVVASAAEQKCAATYSDSTTGPFLIDLTASIAAGLSAKGITITTGGFKVGADGVPTNLGTGALGTKVYLMAYKLGPDAAAGAGTTDFRYAFLSVPNTAPGTAYTASSGTLGVKTGGSVANTAGYPLALYAHIGDKGVSYGEVAQVMGDLQLGHIVLAPAFPGEKVCVSPNADGSCSDDIGKTSFGTSAPYVNDVTDLLGAYECLRGKIVNNSAFVTLSATTGAPNGAVTDLATKYAPISTDLAAIGTSLGGAGASLVAVSSQPLTYTIGFGRGANVVTLAQARAGAVNSIVASTATDATTTAAKTAINSALSLGATFGNTAGLQAFSCSLQAGGNYTYAHAKNKLFLQYWVKGDSPFLNETSKAAIDGIPTFKAHRTKINGIAADTALTEDEKATQIANYVKAIDSSFQIGLAHGSLANWGKVFRVNVLSNAADKLKTIKAAQGAGLLLNGDKDKAADYSNLLINSAISKLTSDAIAAAKANTTADSLDGLGGVNWLSLVLAETLTGATDTGHVTSASFATAKAVASTTSKASTVADDAAYVDKTLADIVPTWLGTECVAKAVISTAAP